MIAASHGPAFPDHTDDLTLSVLGLSTLATASIPIDAVLTRVAELAVEAISGADGAGVTLLQGAGAGTTVATAPFVSRIEHMQRTIGEGPSVTAATEGRTVRCGSLADRATWPAFAAAAVSVGIGSGLCLPLTADRVVLGTMNVYARSPDAFDADAVRVAELFSEPASIAVHNAHVLDEARQLTEQLQTALSTRAIIDQAVGIIRSRSGVTAEEAFDRLRTISQNDNIRVSVVAQKLVDEAARRARQRLGAQPRER